MLSAKSAFTQIEDGVYDDGARGRRELIAILTTSRARPFSEHVMYSCEFLNFRGRFYFVPTFILCLIKKFLRRSKTGAKDKSARHLSTIQN
jgi:hypothetical protein